MNLLSEFAIGLAGCLVSCKMKVFGINRFQILGGLIVKACHEKTICYLCYLRDGPRVLLVVCHPNCVIIAFGQKFDIRLPVEVATVWGDQLLQTSPLTRRCERRLGRLSRYLAAGSDSR